MGRRVVALAVIGTCITSCDADASGSAASTPAEIVDTAVTSTTALSVPIAHTEGAPESAVASGPPVSVGSSEATVSASAEPQIPDTTLPPPLTGGDVSRELAISRPYVDPDVCTPIAAKEWETQDLILRPFAQPSNFPIAMQVIANSVTGPTGPLGLLLRYQDRPLSTNYTELIEINDWQVRLFLAPNGNADARWDLTDGGQGYLRTRDLDRDTIVTLIGDLQPRPPDAALLGFDLAANPGTHPDLAILHEDVNSGHNGRGAWYACRDPQTDIIYRVQTLAGDPLLQYTGIVDRPRPVDVGIVDDTIIVVSGAPWKPEGLFSANQVVNTDQATWDTLLAEPFP